MTPDRTFPFLDTPPRQKVTLHGRFSAGAVVGLCSSGFLADLLCLLFVGGSPPLMLGAGMLILLGSLVIRFLIIRIPHASP